MKIRTAVLLSLVTLAPLGTARAQLSNPLKFTVFAGAALPTGDLKDGVNTGYSVGAALDFHVPLSPIGFRGEGTYSSFGAKDSGGADDADLSDLGLNANVVFWLPSVGSPIRPYLTGGPSYSRTKVSASVSGVDASVKDDNWGFNVGGGLDFALGALSTRLDVRYKRISSKNFFGTGENGTMQYIPITFGLTF
jgi:opacity protein-like surface antigen